MSSKQGVTKGDIFMNGTNASNENAVKHGTTAADNTLTPSKDPLVSRAKQASTAWRRFEDAMKNIIDYSPIFSEMEAAMDRHSVMELETKTKDQRIAALEFSFQVQTEESGKHYMKWIEEKTQLEKKVAAVQNDANAHEQGLLKKQKAIHVQEMEQLKKELGAEKQKVDSLKNELEKVKTGMQKTKDELNRCAGNLSEWEGYFSLLKDVDFKVFDEKVRQLFIRCHKIARTYFLRELPSKVFTDPRWGGLHQDLDVPLSFPPSNSVAAKHIRMAACLHILGRTLCSDIFKPCYLFGPNNLGEAVKDILVQQFDADSKQESLTRALLLSMYNPEEVKSATKQIVHGTSNNILALLGLIGGNEAFRNEIEALFQDAADIWKEAQHSSKMLEASISDDFSDWQWQLLEEFTVPGIDVQPELKIFEKLPLFPRIWVPEERHIVHRGFVLLPDQNTVVAAQQELRQSMKKLKNGWNASTPAGSIRRERRLSMKIDGRPGVPLSSPTNPRAESKASSFFGAQWMQPRGSQTPNGTRGEG